VLLVPVDRSKTTTESGSVYLDELTISAAYRLLRIRGLTKVTVLEAIKPWQKLLQWLFRKKGVDVVEASFFAGHLKTKEGESGYISARRLAGQIALISANEIVNAEIYLQRLNKAYKRNTIRLFIAKQLHLHIEYWTIRALVAQALCEKGRATIWLKKPVLFDEKLLIKSLSGVNLQFYPTIRFRLVSLAMGWFLNVARDIKLTIGVGQRSRFFGPEMPQKQSILLFQEGNIRADRTLRTHLHWLEVNKPIEMFDTYVVKLRFSKVSIVEDVFQLSKAGIKLIPTSAFRYAVQAMWKDKTIVRVRQDRRTAIWAIFRRRGFANKFFLLRVAALLRQAELMGALALWLNSKVFLIRETMCSFADAMQLIASDIGVTTIAYQYSNIGAIAPLIMTTADKFLVFSDMYKTVYQSDGIAPQEFLPTGYLYDGVASLVREKAKKHREVLMRAGARFIICYFDESVQHDRWGLVSKDDHLCELHALANVVLLDPEFGVVVKSQFIRNSPSQLYPNDDVIRAAKATGRFLELMEGVHRNDIYPTEAALVADLCIGHKFGATAALEAAIAGVRTVLLDVYGTKTAWDDIYAKADIVYQTMESLMDAIADFRAGSKTQQTIGDWTSILHHFDPYRDGKAKDRLYKVVEQSLPIVKKE